MKTTKEQRAEWLRYGAGEDTAHEKIITELCDDIDEALADLAKERERAEDVFKDNVRLCAEKTRVWVENAALRAELETTKARLAEAEREAESFELAWGADINAIRPALQRAGLHHYGPLDGHRIAQQMDEITSARDTLRAELETTKARLAEAERAIGAAWSKLTEWSAVRLKNGSHTASDNPHAALLSACESNVALHTELETTKARLAEAERLLDSNQQLRRELSDQASALRAELAECRAELASACDERDTADAELSECRAELNAQAGLAQEAVGEETRLRKAAESRAERLSNEPDEASRMYTTAQAGREAAEARAERLRGLLVSARAFVESYSSASARAVAGDDLPSMKLLHAIDAALAETAQKTSEAFRLVDARAEPTRSLCLHAHHGKDMCGEVVHHGAAREGVFGSSYITTCACTATSSPDDAVRELTQEAQRLGMYDDDAERVALAWMNEQCASEGGIFARFGRNNMTLENACDDGCDCLPTLARLLRTRDAQAREAGRVEGWTEAVEACANQCQVSIRFNEDPRLAMPIMPTRFRALERPDRAKGGAGLDICDCWGDAVRFTCPVHGKNAKK